MSDEMRIAFDETLAELAEAVCMQRQPMEGFCDVVMQCGYRPSDCVLNIYPEVNGGRREVLTVKGVAVFEVTTMMRHEPEHHRIVYVIKPRIIEWPLGYPVAT